MSRASFDSTAVRQKFKLGAKVTTFDPGVPTYFDFMTLATNKVAFPAGGLVHVTCQFAGAESRQFGNEGGGLAGG